MEEHKTHTMVLLETIGNMGYDELCEKIPVAEAEAVDIQAQITKSIGEAKATGAIHADPMWLSRATNALRVKRFTIIQMQRRKKLLKKEYADSRAREFAAIFMYVAETILDKAVYDNLIAKTKEKMEEE